MDRRKNTFIIIGMQYSKVMKKSGKGKKGKKKKDKKESLLKTPKTGDAEVDEKLCVLNSLVTHVTFSISSVPHLPLSLT